MQGLCGSSCGDCRKKHCSECCGGENAYVEQQPLQAAGDDKRELSRGAEPPESPLAVPPAVNEDKRAAELRRQSSIKNTRDIREGDNMRLQKARDNHENPSEPSDIKSKASDRDNSKTSDAAAVPPQQPVMTRNDATAAASAGANATPSARQQPAFDPGQLGTVPFANRASTPPSVANLHPSTAYGLHGGTHTISPSAPLTDAKSAVLARSVLNKVADMNLEGSLSFASPSSRQSEVSAAVAANNLEVDVTAAGSGERSITHTMTPSAHNAQHYFSGVAVPVPEAATQTATASAAAGAVAPTATPVAAGIPAVATVNAPAAANPAPKSRFSFGPVSIASSAAAAAADDSAVTASPSQNTVTAAAEQEGVNGGARRSAMAELVAAAATRANDESPRSLSVAPVVDDEKERAKRRSAMYALIYGSDAVINAGTVAVMSATTASGVLVNQPDNTTAAALPGVLPSMSGPN